MSEIWTGVRTKDMLPYSSIYFNLTFFHTKATKFAKFFINQDEWPKFNISQDYIEQGWSFCRFCTVEYQPMTSCHKKKWLSTSNQGPMQKLRSFRHFLFCVCPITKTNEYRLGHQTFLWKIKNRMSKSRFRAYNLIYIRPWESSFNF